jgi:hypothetical protein
LQSIKETVGRCPGRDDEALKKVATNLYVFLHVQLYLRVVALLAIVGTLSEQHKQGVAALLGGEPHSSSSSSSLPLPEPAGVAAVRMEHSLALQDLAIRCLWGDTKMSDQEQECHELAQLCSVPDHLLMAFGADQLPWLAIMQQSSKPAATQDSQKADEYLQLRERAARATQVFSGAVGSEYVSWMNASLMKIINEVLSQA